MSQSHGGVSPSHPLRVLAEAAVAGAAVMVEIVLVGAFLFFLGLALMGALAMCALGRRDD